MKYNLGKWNITNEEQNNPQKQNITQDKKLEESDLALRWHITASVVQGGKSMYFDSIFIFREKHHAG